MNKKSRTFLNELESTLFDIEPVIYGESDKKNILHIVYIIELIKYGEFDNLIKYIDDDIEHTDKNNYSYRVRDRLENKIISNMEFIREIENNE